MKCSLLINSIYKITNKINKKIYIGQTWTSILQRFNQHKQDSKRWDYPIHKAIRKYGINSFTIELVIITNTQECANFWEDYFINYYNSLGGGGYNAKNGGSNGKLSPEHKRKIALSRIGKPRSQETRNRISTSQIYRLMNGGKPSRLGAIVSKETREKISLSHKGKEGTSGSFLPGNVPWNKGKKITKPPIRKPMSEATKAKISASKKGKLLSEDTKNKISIALIGNTNKRKS